MADKQATVYIVDLGTSMGAISNGRSQSDLDFALTYIWDRITTTVSNGRKTDMVGVIGFRTDECDNEMRGDEAYEHITVLQPIQQTLMPDLRQLKDALKPSRKTDVGDGISAIVIGIQLITKHCKKLKYTKNIVLVTNGTGEFEPDGLEDIAGQMKAEKIGLMVLGVDFDDAEYGFKEEDKDVVKARNEEVLKQLCDYSGGLFGTMEEAVAELGRPRVKQVRPVANFKGKLSLGDPQKSEAAFSIDVERFPKTMDAKPVSASRYVDRPGAATQAEGAMETEEGDGLELQAVKMARVYKVKDDDDPETNKEIDREDMEKGYKYGSTIVPISATDEMITVLETEPSMQIVGFIDASKYQRYYSMSTTCMIVGQKANDAAQMALSSLIHALYELETYALIRFVRRANDAPVMLICAPFIQPDFECLIDVQVPFIEDVRPYEFPPLDVVRTAAGKILDKHRFLPTQEMDKAMEDYVDAMDLDAFAGDDEDAEEFAASEDTFSPLVHRVNQVIRHRAIHPDAPMPEPYPILTRFSNPPQEVVDKAVPALQRLIKACDVKKVEAKVKGRREPPRPKSGLDVGALLARVDTTPAPLTTTTSGSKPTTTLGIGFAPPTSRTPAVAPISLQNAVPEFKRKLEVLEEESDFAALATQMLGHVRTLVRTSMADVNYSRACELLAVMREEFEELDFARVYNGCLKELREDVANGRLDGERWEWWKMMKDLRLGLIVGEGGVGEEEARQFWLVC